MSAALQPLSSAVPVLETLGTVWPGLADAVAPPPQAPAKTPRSREAAAVPGAAKKDAEAAARPASAVILSARDRQTDGRTDGAACRPAVVGAADAAPIAFFALPVLCPNIRIARATPVVCAADRIGRR